MCGKMACIVTAAGKEYTGSIYIVWVIFMPSSGLIIPPIKYKISFYKKNRLNGS